MTKQTIIYFSLGYDTNATLVLVNLLLRQISETIKECRIYYKQVYENDFEDLRINDHLDLFLKDIADRLCVDAFEQFGVTVTQQTNTPKSARKEVKGKEVNEA